GQTVDPPTTEYLSHSNTQPIDQERLLKRGNSYLFSSPKKNLKICFEKPISCVYICNRRVANVAQEVTIKMKVEVFKTNVADPERAKWLVDQIERNFTNCKVNFDLDDCDRILRVVTKN